MGISPDTNNGDFLASDGGRDFRIKTRVDEIMGRLLTDPELACGGSRGDQIRRDFLANELPQVLRVAPSADELRRHFNETAQSSLHERYPGELIAPDIDAFHIRNTTLFGHEQGTRVTRHELEHAVALEGDERVVVKFKHKFGNRPNGTFDVVPSVEIAFLSDMPNATCDAISERALLATSERSQSDVALLRRIRESRRQP